MGVACGCSLSGLWVWFEWFVGVTCGCSLSGLWVCVFFFFFFFLLNSVIKSAKSTKIK